MSNADEVTRAAVAPFSESGEKTMEMKESNDENVYRVCGMGS